MQLLLPTRSAPCRLSAWSRVRALRPELIARFLLLCVVSLTIFSTNSSVRAAAPSPHRILLAEALLADDSGKQIALVKKLVDAGGDPLIAQALGAWRQGGVFLLETNNTRTPFILDSQTDADGKAKAIGLPGGEPLTDAAGKALSFSATALTPVDTDSKLRKAIKLTLDLFALANPNPNLRRDAVTKLGQEQNPDYLPFFTARLPEEKDPQTQRALAEAIALTHLADEDAKVRVPAIRRLAELRSITSLSFLQKLEIEAKSDTKKWGVETWDTAHAAVQQIETYMAWGNFVGTGFRGLSLSAVLLVAALGLAITFGLMGIINMAHGEVMMVGAYSAYVTQNVFTRWFGASGRGFDSYFLAALVVSFVVAGLVGLALERGIIRYLYKRPLESLLATWGVSLVLQQLFRATFGAANVQVSSPSWLSGSFVISDILLAYNRIFVIAFAVFVVLLTYLLLTRTSLGLQIRAVMQNRSMASALGVRTDRVNMMTFAYGSGLAGMAGACLSQIGNVGPSLGQNYIIDCFMVVVLGGVGNLFGTVFAALGIGVTDQILQPWLGAVMGKITVLAGIILFLQWRPAGLFVTRSRSLEG